MDYISIDRIHCTIGIMLGAVVHMEPMKPPSYNLTTFLIGSLQFLIAFAFSLGLQPAQAADNTTNLQFVQNMIVGPHSQKLEFMESLNYIENSSYAGKEIFLDNLFSAISSGQLKVEICDQSCDFEGNIHAQVVDSCGDDYHKFVGNSDLAFERYSQCEKPTLFKIKSKSRIGRDYALSTDNLSEIYGGVIIHELQHFLDGIEFKKRLKSDRNLSKLFYTDFLKDPSKQYKCEDLAQVQFRRVAQNMFWIEGRGYLAQERFLQSNRSGQISPNDEIEMRKDVLSIIESLMSKRGIFFGEKEGMALLNAAIDSNDYWEFSQFLDRQYGEFSVSNLRIAQTMQQSQPQGPPGIIKGLYLRCILNYSLQESDEDKDSLVRTHN